MHNPYLTLTGKFKYTVTEGGVEVSVLPDGNLEIIGKGADAETRKELEGRVGPDEEVVQIDRGDLETALQTLDGMLKNDGLPGIWPAKPSL